MRGKQASSSVPYSTIVKSAWQVPFRKLAKYQLLIFFFVASIVVQVGIFILPFRTICCYLGYQIDDIEKEHRVSKKNEHRALAIGQTCERATSILSLKSKCLVHAILTKTILSLLDIPCVVHIGVCRNTDTNTGFKAHAWIRVGRHIVTGRRGSKRYTTISRFANSRFISDSRD